jgi:ankyrin repeat protein
MTAAHRGRLECARALLRAGADPNYVSPGGDLALFWAIDGGPEMIKLFAQFGAKLDARSPKGWTPLSYARAKGKYGAVEDRGIYPEVRRKK